MIQHTVYHREIADLKSSWYVKKSSELHSLCPVLGKHEMLQVCGGLKNSSLPYENQHQINLPSRHHLTEFIVRADHQRLLRVGPQNLLASLRPEYWISRGRQVQQSILDEHSPCFKQWAVASQQLMGHLLTPWVQLERPFLNCGVDYAWPFYVKQGTPRSKIQVKCYVTIFICSCQGSSILIAQQFNVRCLYCCPSKVYCTKGQVLKFVFWQWDSICWSSLWTLRTQEACCIGRTSVKNSGIYKFRSIYMAFYSPALRETLGGWHALYEILLKRLLGVTAKN